MVEDDPFWRDKDRLKEAYDSCGTLDAISVRYGVSKATLNTWWKRHGLPPLKRGPKFQSPRGTTVNGEGNPDQWALDALKALGDGASVEQIADYSDVSPKRVRDAMERLAKMGYRVESTHAGHIKLERVPPDRDNLHLDLLDGKKIIRGLVSDTHLCSNENALEELHLAYDWFEREGVREVWHCGDIIEGRGIYRGHDVDIYAHTIDSQVDVAVKEYPRRKKMVTRVIGGNHDLEGVAGSVGLDTVQAIANRRDDMEYLGSYSAWMQLGEGGPWVHLLHGKGGMSYAYSYKAQKIVDGYPAGRKPALTCAGHWHVRGQFTARNVEFIFPGCFQWSSKFMQRLGLTPAVGFHLLELTVGEDGSLTQIVARWLKFYEGRIVG